MPKKSIRRKRQSSGGGAPAKKANSMTINAHEKSIVGRRCLIVDNERLIALDIQDILQAAGATTAIVCANDLGDVLSSIQKNGPFDLALVDLRLDHKGQPDLAIAQILARHYIPFAFLTALCREEVLVLDFLHAPIVEKPYRADLLLKALSQAGIAPQPENRGVARRPLTCRGPPRPPAPLTGAILSCHLRPLEKSRK
jgi:CheY-like chemotaxis protein